MEIELFYEFASPYSYPAVMVAERAAQARGQLNFLEDREIDDERNMRALLTELGLDADQVLQRALASDNRERLRKQTERAQRLGVFGAPTFVVDGELFWGHDRMQQALAWAARAAARAR